MEYYVYLAERFKEKDEIIQWVEEYDFYRVKIEDLENDWRTCQVKDKRNESIYLGNVFICGFPIIYPLKLSNGIEIEDLNL